MVINWIWLYIHLCIYIYTNYSTRYHLHVISCSCLPVFAASPSHRWLKPLIMSCQSGHRNKLTLDNDNNHDNKTQLILDLSTCNIYLSIHPSIHPSFYIYMIQILYQWVASPLKADSQPSKLRRERTKFWWCLDSSSHFGGRWDGLALGLSLWDWRCTLW